MLKLGVTLDNDLYLLHMVFVSDYRGQPGHQVEMVMTESTELCFGNKRIAQIRRPIERDRDCFNMTMLGFGPECSPAHRNFADTELNRKMLSAITQSNDLTWYASIAGVHEDDVKTYTERCKELYRTATGEHSDETSPDTSMLH